MAELEHVYCTAQELPKDKAPPTWVHLIPCGAFKGRDGRRWTLNNPHALIEHFNRNKADLPIDYEHQTAHASRLQAENGPVPAAGWITELERRIDGIWGRVSWTDRAAEMIQNREYRYLSPVFLSNAKTKDVSVLKGAGLVHTPNLYLTNLAREEKPMATATSKTQDIALALGLPTDATTDTIVQEINRMDVADPGKYVPLAAVKDLMEERNAQLLDARAAQVEHTVGQAIADGKITPAMRGWATELCTQNPESFADFIETTPAPYAHLLTSDPRFDKQPPKTATGRLTDEELELCRQLGVTPEQYLEANK